MTPPPIRARYTIAQTGLPEGHAKRSTLLWGPSQTGKTHCAMTWPSPFFIYFDPDTQTLEGTASRVPFIHVPDLKTMEQIAEDVRHGRMTELVRTLPGFEDYTVQTVVLDSASALGRMVDDEQKDNGVVGIPRWDAKKQQLHKIFLHLIAGSKWSAAREQYYLVVTAHEAEKTDSEGNVREVVTSISGKFGEELFQYFSDIILTRRTSGQNPKFHARTSAPNAHYKSVGMRAINNPPPVLEQGATYPELARYWYASKEKTDG